MINYHINNLNNYFINLYIYLLYVVCLLISLLFYIGFTIVGLTILGGINCILSGEFPNYYYLGIGS